MSSLVSISPDSYFCFISSIFSSDSSNNILRYWNETSTSVLPPFSLCSSVVFCPPENAYLFIFFLIVFGLSERKISPSPEDDILVLPCRDGKNFAWSAAGFSRFISLCVAMSRVNRMNGSWSIATGTTEMCCFFEWNCGKSMWATCIAGKKDHPMFWSGFRPKVAFAIE